MGADFGIVVWHFVICHRNTGLFHTGGIFYYLQFFCFELKVDRSSEKEKIQGIKLLSKTTVHADSLREVRFGEIPWLYSFFKTSSFSSIGNSVFFKTVSLYPSGKKLIRKHGINSWSHWIYLIPWICSFTFRKVFVLPSVLTNSPSLFSLFDFFLLPIFFSSNPVRHSI